MGNRTSAYMDERERLAARADIRPVHTELIDDSLSKLVLRQRLLVPHSEEGLNPALIAFRPALDHAWLTLRGRRLVSIPTDCLYNAGPRVRIQTFAWHPLATLPSDRSRAIGSFTQASGNWGSKSKLSKSRTKSSSGAAKLLTSAQLGRGMAP
jgi:hypothetical protein